MILAVLARDAERVEAPASPGSRLRTPGACLFAGVIALVLLCRHLLVGRVPPPGRYHPGAINGMGPGVEAAVFGLGFLSLILVGACVWSGRSGRPRLRVFAGVLLAAAVLVQCTVEMRFGTWVEEKPKYGPWSRWTGRSGRISPSPVFRASGWSPPPSPARWSAPAWSCGSRSSCSVVLVSSMEEAYDYLAASGRAGTLVVESGEWVPREGRATAPAAPPTAGADLVDLSSSSFNRLRFSVEARLPGYLLLSVPFAPGWRALVDREPAATVRANGYALAVPVPAGVHEVEFLFFSDSTQTGFRIFCVTLAVLLLLLALRIRGRGRWAAAMLAVALPCGGYFAWQASLHRGDNLGTRYRWTSADLPPSGNLAHGKRTRMSSIFSDLKPTQFYAGLAVDGRRRGMPFVTSPKDPAPWWEVDLGREWPLAEVVIHGAVNAGPHLPLLVRVSTDGANYRTLLAAGAIPDGGDRRIPLPAATARYLRLQSSGKGALALGEVEVFAAGFETPDGPPQGATIPLPARE